MKIGGELLSRNRMELYGIATLGIVLVHAQSVVVSLPAAVLKVLSFGGIGVYVNIGARPPVLNCKRKMNKK